MDQVNNVFQIFKINFVEIADLKQGFKSQDMYDKIDKISDVIYKKDKMKMVIIEIPNNRVDKYMNVLGPLYLDLLHLGHVIIYIPAVPNGSFNKLIYPHNLNDESKNFVKLINDKPTEKNQVFTINFHTMLKPEIERWASLYRRKFSVQMHGLIYSSYWEKKKIPIAIDEGINPHKEIGQRGGFNKYIKYKCDYMALKNQNFNVKKINAILSS